MTRYPPIAKLQASLYSRIKTLSSLLVDMSFSGVSSGAKRRARIREHGKKNALSNCTLDALLSAATTVCVCPIACTALVNTCIIL
jgi:hypothetical protein